MNKQLTKHQIEALRGIRSTKGRFFGLKTTQGQTINAQFRNETSEYITVYDRNAGRLRKLAKTSIRSVN